MLNYFEKNLQVSLPEFCNPFDLALKVLQNPKKQGEDFYFEYKNSLLEKIEDKTSKYGEEYSNIKLKQLESGYSNVSWIKEFTTLLSRGMLSYFRNKTVFYARLVNYLFNSIILMGFYFGIGNKDNIFFNLLGICFNTTNNYFITGMFTSLFMFPVIRKVLKREYSAKMYRVSSFYFHHIIVTFIPALIYSLIFSPTIYFSLQTVMDFPGLLLFWLCNFCLFSLSECFGTMCGAALGDQLGLIVSPLFFVLFLLGSGFFRSNDSFPSALIWLNWISPYRYMMEIYLGVFQNFNEITKMIAPMMGYTVGIGNCVLILCGFWLLVLVLGFLFVKQFSSKF